MIYVDSRRKKEKTLRKKYPNAILCDVTSKAQDGLIKLSPFYPHDDIPIPFSNGRTATCVEGVWQGLKVFDSTDVDISLFSNSTMKNIKRTTRKYGSIIGHRKGIYSNQILDYSEARRLIYIPTYKWVLENKVLPIIERLRKAAEKQDIVLLDYNTNCDVFNLDKPLSHAFLIKAYAESIYPYEETLGCQYNHLENNSVDEYTMKDVFHDYYKEETNK